jgi:hypothetical protein
MSSRARLCSLLPLCLSLFAMASEQPPLAQRHDERQFDPPAPAAKDRPLSEALRLKVPSFSIFQVNITATGFNIVGDAANEPSIAVDPTQPERIAIGWRQFDSIASSFRKAGYAYSSNGGRNWTYPGTLDGGAYRSDPVLQSDLAGNFYYNSLKVVGNVFSTDVFISTNGGQTWGPPIFSYGGDKAWITVDRTTGLGSGHIYQAWSTAANQYDLRTFNRSTDGGASYATPDSIPQQPFWGSLDVAPDGTLYVVGADEATYSNFFVARSSNAKDPLSGVTWTTSQAAMGGAMTYAASPNPGGLAGQAWIAVDPVSPNQVYVLCSVDPPGSDPLDVHFVRSIDGGATWSSPVRINDDPVGGNKWQWFATMSVAPNGRIDVVWNDTRNSTDYRLSRLYYSSSSDGGLSWSPNDVLSPTFNSHVGWPSQNKLGDYYHMVSDRVGAHLAWSATFANEQNVYYSRIGEYDCNGNGIADPEDIYLETSRDFNEDGIPDECQPGATGVEDITTIDTYRLHPNRPNPFNPSTTIRYDVPAGGGRIRLCVFDATGRHVRTLADRVEFEGPKSALWDGRDDGGRQVASGLYIYQLETPTSTHARKMLLVK